MHVPVVLCRFQGFELDSNLENQGIPDSRCESLIENNGRFQHTMLNMCISKHELVSGLRLHRQSTFSLDNLSR